jgi:rhomboid protease GluP
MNGYSLVQLAPFVERVWGWARFLVVYVVSAIAGAALSSRGSLAISVGASGALFGLCGFLIVAAYSGTHRHEVRTIVRGTWGQGLLLSLGGVLVYGFTPGSHIDNLAHLGGGIAGAVLGLILVETEEDDTAMRAMGAGAALAIVAAWVALALDARKTAQFEAEVRVAESDFASGRFVAAADACERALALRPRDPRGRELLLLEGLAYLRGDKVDEASYTLERAWRNEPIAEIAALLVEAHWRRGDKAAARSWSEQLHELKTPAEIAAMNLPPETRAAVAAVSSR